MVLKEKNIITLKVEGRGKSLEISHDDPDVIFREFMRWIKEVYPEVYAALTKGLLKK